MSGRALPSMPGMLLKAIATLRRRQDGALAESGLEASYEIGHVDTAHIAKYRDIIGSQVPHLPLTYFYLPAQRAQVSLMLDRRFPYAIPGLIHATNEMRLHRLPELHAPLVANVSVRPHGEGRSGPRFVFKVDLMQLGDLVVSCVSEYQIRSRERARPADGAEVSERPASSVMMSWEATASAVRRYARVSGDFNPIHLSSSLARAFGQRSAICQGMYCVGRVAASVERQSGRQVIAIAARFRRPIPVPGRVGINIEPGLDDGVYSVWSEPEPSLRLSGSWSLA